MKETDEDIRKRLSSLPRVGAPPDFEEKLRRRISSGRGKESPFRLWSPGFAVPAATLVVVGVLSSVLYMTQFRSTGDTGDIEVPDVRMIPSDSMGSGGNISVPESGSAPSPRSKTGALDQTEPAPTTRSDQPPPSPPDDRPAEIPPAGRRIAPALQERSRQKSIPVPERPEEIETRNETPLPDGGVEKGALEMMGRPPATREGATADDRKAPLLLRNIVPGGKLRLPQALTDTAFSKSSPVRKILPSRIESTGVEGDTGRISLPDSTATHDSSSAGGSIPDRDAGAGGDSVTHEVRPEEPDSVRFRH